MIPDLSIFCSAAHPEYWMRFNDTLKPTSVNYEVICVGPNEPTYTMPDNFRFIKSMVKVTQCFEIALRECRGEFAMNFTDDCWFTTPSPLDALFAHYYAVNNPLLMVSPCYTFNGMPWQRETHRVDVTDPASPCMPVCGLTKKKLIVDSGGVDRDFIALFWDLDIAMRLYAMGGEVSLANVMMVEDRGKPGSLFDQGYLSLDRNRFDDYWDNGRRRERKYPVASFEEKDLLTVSQGPKGGWT